MIEDPQSSDQTPELSRKVVLVENETAENLPEGNLNLVSNQQIESTDEPELVRKPVVISVDPEPEEDRSRTPKNTNISPSNT